MAYVMLSRVQAIDQLFILNKLDSEKFYTDKAAQKECENMKEKCLNSNPTVWERDGAMLKVSLLNINRLRSKLPDLAADQLILKSDVICLGETWLESDEVDLALSLPGYQLTLNSAGPGKGVATYYRADELSFKTNVKTEKAQVTKLSSANLDVINIYRSAGATDLDLVTSLGQIIDQTRLTLIVGDLNLCYVKKRDSLFLKYLDSLNFKQMTPKATHIAGGTLDLVYSNHAVVAGYKVEAQVYSPWYTYNDHDALLITVSLVSYLLLKFSQILQFYTGRNTPARIQTCKT